jgi:hypothetical protein
VITSAEEFVRLRSSEIRLKYLQTAHDSADVQVLLKVIEKYAGFQE